MKIYLILIIVFSSMTYIIAQQDCIEKSIIIQEDFHYGAIGINTDPVLKSYTLTQNKAPLISFFRSSTYSENYPLSLCWDIDRDKEIIYLINSYISYKPGRETCSIGFHRIKLGFGDSAKYYIMDTITLNEFPKFKNDDFTIKSSQKRNEEFSKFVNSKHIKPIKELFKYYYKEQQQEEKRYGQFIMPYLQKPYQMTDITYDFCWLHDNIFTFYIRDDNQLTQWKYTYTEEKTVKPEDWQEQQTWSTQNVGSYTIQHENPYLPSGKKHIYNCIKDTSTNIMLTDTSFVLLSKVLPDSTLQKLLPIQGVPFTNDNDFNDTLFARIDTIQALQFKKWIKQTGRNLFFKGFIEAIVQNGHTFIINRHYGGIYWLSKDGIYRIAQIDVNNYPKKLLGKKLFIEDRDNEQLIFFAPVTKLNEQVPYPNIKIIQNKREFNRMFKNVPSN